MRLTTLDLSIFIVYMLAVLGVGLYAAKRGTKTKRDYFLAGDKLPWWMIGGSIVAANISSHHLVGIMGIAYSRGFVAMVNEWGAILIGFNALLWIFLPFYLRNGFYTVPEFLARRFGPAARMLYAGLIVLIYLFVEIAAVLYLGAIPLYKLVGIDVRYCIVLLGVFIALYTVTGGLRAVVWTEMLQLVVLLLGGAALTIAVFNRMGLRESIQTITTDAEATGGLLLPASDPDFPWTMYLGASLCVSTFYCAANQFIVQRVLAAKDEWHARMGVIFTDYLKFLIPLIIIVPGLLARDLVPGLQRADEVFPTLVKELLPTGLIGLVMAGLIAAVMGHVSGAVNSCTTIVTVDFYLPYKRWRAQRQEMLPTATAAEPTAVIDYANPSTPTPPVEQPDAATDAQAVRFGRIVAIVIVVIGILWTELLSRNIDRPMFIYLLNAYGWFAPGIGTMFLLGILWKRTTHAGALTAGALTVPLSALIQWVFPNMSFMNRTGIVFWLCMIACVLVSLMTTPKPEHELKGLVWTRDSLRLPAEERHKYRGLRRPVVWWAIITVVVLYFYIRYA